MPYGPLPPANVSVAHRYSGELAAIGARVDPRGGQFPRELMLEFSTPRHAAIADGLLSDTVQGVKLLTRGMESAPREERPVTARDIADLAANLPGVQATQHDPSGAMTVFAEAEPYARHLEPLLADSFGDTPIVVAHR